MRASRKRAQPKTSINGSKVDSDLHWYQRCEPLNLTDLALHPKKREEVQSWLHRLYPQSVQSTSLDSNFREPDEVAKQNCSRLALLSGPAGSCKTATIRLLCEKNNIELKEIASDPSATFKDSNSTCSKSYGPSQVTKFKEYIFSMSMKKLGADQSSSSKNNGQVLLIEDLPNSFYTRPHDYHQVLRHFVRVHKDTHIPIVFIVSDTGESADLLNEGSSRGKMSSHNLFPQEFLDELNFVHIKFNPVPKTYIKKALQRLASFDQFSPRDIETVCSLGDIRSAFNALEFNYSHRPGFSEIVTVERTKKRRPCSQPVQPCGESNNPQLNGNTNGNENEDGYIESASSMQKRDRLDAPLHFVGKVLYAKRVVSEDMLPETVRELPLVENLTELVRRLPMPPSHLMLHCQQIYDEHNPGSLKVCARMIDNYSLADRFGLFDVDGFSSRASGHEIQTELVVRGTMYYTNPGLVLPSGDKYRGNKPWDDYDSFSESKGLVAPRKLEFYDRSRKLKRLFEEVDQISSYLPCSITNLFTDILFVTKPCVFQVPRISEQDDKVVKKNADAIKFLLNLTNRIRKEFKVDDDMDLFDDDMDQILAEL